MNNDSDVKNFIEEWLNHFRITFQEQVKINSVGICDFLVENYSLGIFIVDWKKPISVHIVNKALQMCTDAKIKKLYLVADSISEPARKLLDKFHHIVTPIHPNCLSTIAMEFAQTFTKPEVGIAI